MSDHEFQHLNIVQIVHGDAKLSGRGGSSQATSDNKKQNRQKHSRYVAKKAAKIGDYRKKHIQDRKSKQLPDLPYDTPVLLKLDPKTYDIDFLHEMFDFEIISEHEDGYVILSSPEVDLSAFHAKATGFESKTVGTARIAEIHEVLDDPQARKERVLSSKMEGIVESSKDSDEVIVEIGVSCLGNIKFPKPISRYKRDTDESWRKRQEEWTKERSETYQKWDDLKYNRETQVDKFISDCNGDILNIIDGKTGKPAELPDSFTVKAKISVQAVKDLAVNYPHVFEIKEPSDVSPIPIPDTPEQYDVEVPKISAPEDDAPAVCVLDSGIQENHPWLQAAILSSDSHCYLPSKQSDETGDEVKPGGHGTKVAGAVLYPREIPVAGDHSSRCWIQNARVLDQNNNLPSSLFPPRLLESIVDRYSQSSKETKIFNHSIGGWLDKSEIHMSPWAATVDKLAYDKDILFIQAAGNIYHSDSSVDSPGVKEYLENGKEYPKYLEEESSRIVDPAQSFQALTVGSVSHDEYSSGDWKSIAPKDYPSSFSRTGPGMWGSIKPEIVDYGGDYGVNSADDSIQIGQPPELKNIYPNLVQKGGDGLPPVERLGVGTSFSAPKVSAVAAKIQEVLPDASALLYKALLVQSARWPDWAMKATLEERGKIIHQIGYGMIDEQRATINDDHRITFVSEDLKRIKAGEAHVYRINVPEEVRNPGDDSTILIEITMTYAANPRRTRRHLRGYYSSRVDWKTSKHGESVASFRSRCLKNQPDASDGQNQFSWTIHEGDSWGSVKGIRRNKGAVQKDWTLVKSNQLPEDFCIAVVGHKGWDRDPDSTAKYAFSIK